GVFLRRTDVKSDLVRSVRRGAIFRAKAFKTAFYMGLCQNPKMDFPTKRHKCHLNHIGKTAIK
ncbi:hypothetical protein HMPREF1988_01917, partial [Porphyromonas gingivalis F0185]